MLDARQSSKHTVNAWTTTAIDSRNVEKNRKNLKNVHPCNNPCNNALERTRAYVCMYVTDDTWYIICGDSLLHYMGLDILALRKIRPTYSVLCSQIMGS